MTTRSEMAAQVDVSGGGWSTEWLLAAGMAAVGVLAAAAQRSRLPYPIYLLLAGLALGFVPGMPHIELEPELVFLVFLPPLIYAAAYFTSLHELKRNARHVSMLAVGLVLATTITVAVVAHAVIPGLGWAPAFVLGAIVSPTDPVAGSAVLEKLRVPRRIVHIVEGESLINDGSGIVLYRVAVAAVVSGAFSVVDAGLQFALSCVGGLLVGLGVGVVVMKLRRSNEHGPTDVLLSLIAGYLAYLPAEALHVSGVLATAACGLFLGWNTPRIVRDAETRLQIRGVWVNVNFVINFILFLLIGLQMHAIVERIGDEYSAAELVGYAAAVSATVIGTRLLWMFPATWASEWVAAGFRAPAKRPGWRPVLLIGWIGMRGAVSLAAALALPTTIDGGAPFPHRDLLVYLVFCVIVATLLIQGLSLGRMVRWLDLGEGDEYRRAEHRARLAAAQAAVEHIDGPLAEAGWMRDDSRLRMRALHDFRTRRFTALDEGSEDAEAFTERAEAWVRASREIYDVQREALIDLRNRGEISDEVMQAVHRDLDHEELHVRL